MKIIQASTAHLAELTKLFDGYRVFYEQESDLKGAEQFLKARLENQESIILIALDDDENGLGFTQLYPTFSSVSMEQSYILNDLYVLPNERGQRIGESLLNAAKTLAKANKWKGLALETATDNPAQKLYERLGWERSDGFYHYFWTS